MKLNDKVKEVTDNWTAWGNCYSEMNKELESKHPDPSKLVSLLEKKKHLSNQRDTLMQELQTLLDKTSEDIRLKLDRFLSSKESL